MNEDLTKLPDNLPQPEDDGTCDHLLGKMIPDMTFSTTRGNSWNICDLEYDFVILYFFPMMGIPGKRLIAVWNSIPGTRGCTPKNITLSEHKNDLLKFHSMLIGVSTQPVDELSMLSKLRGLSQVILSDDTLKFKEKLGVPTVHVENKTMYKRLTLILKKSRIVKVFYPVFPPDKHIFEILEWLEDNHTKH